MMKYQVKRLDGTVEYRTARQLVGIDPPPTPDRSFPSPWSTNPIGTHDLYGVMVEILDANRRVVLEPVDLATAERIVGAVNAHELAGATA